MLIDKAAMLKFSPLPQHVITDVKNFAWFIGYPKWSQYNCKCDRHSPQYESGMSKCFFQPSTNMHQIIINCW